MVMRASGKCHTALEARLPSPDGLKDDVVGKASEKAFEQDHRAPCLQEHAHMSFGWRRASHFVSFRGLGSVNIRSTRSHCV